MGEFKSPPDMCFTGNADENWKTWSQQYEYYMIASGKKKKPEGEKIAILLNMMGPEAQRIYNTFDFQSPSEKASYEATLAKFQEYCAPKKNLVYEHYVFFSRTQGEEETAEQYFTALKNLAATCEFKERDVMIRDRIVLGTKHKRLQEKMLSEPDLKMEAAIEYCRNYERTKLLIKDIQKTDEAQNDAIVSTKWRPPNTERTRSRTKPPEETRWRPTREVKKKKPTGDTQTNQRKCANCGTPHEYRNCPAFNKRCNNCNKYNHYAKMCRSRAINTVDLSDESELDEDPNEGPAILYSISETEKGDWHELIEINNKTVRVKMDTGAQVNVLNSRTYKELQNKEPLVPAKRKLMSYTGHVIEVQGVARLKCKWLKHQLVTDFYVTQNESSACVLGLPTIKKLKILKIDHQNISLLTESDPPSILEKYKDVFEGNGVLNYEYKITLAKGAQPVTVPPRPIPYAIKQEVKNELDRLVDQGILIPVTEPTPWTSPITIVAKQGKKPRICMDPRNLNRYIIRERCWIPTVNTIFAELGKAKVFTVLDASNAFHQVQLDPKSSRLCTIATPFGRYRYTRLPYGLSSAPEVFQRAVSTMLEGIKGTTNYIDDILVYGTTKEEHNKALDQVLTRARQIGLKLSKTKTQLAKDSIQFLGHIVSSEGIQVDPEKTAAITRMKRPTTKKELQRFLGIITYISRYLPGLSEASAPLRAILSKKNLWQWEPQGPEEQAFNKLKQLVTKAPILRHYDPEEHIKLSVDASAHGLGAVLLQANSPVAYASATLTPAQKRYNQIEKELLAIVYACEHFNHYVFGRDITVETDHSPLLTIVKKPIDSLTPRLQRLVLRLLRYSVKLVHVPGRKIQVADALSRDPEEATFPTAYLDEIYTELPIQFKSPARAKALVKATQEDDEFKTILQYVKAGWPQRQTDLPAALSKYWPMQAELTTDGGLLYKGKTICIPKTAREEVLNIIHATHQGENACKARAKEMVYWPGITSDIVTKIKTCLTCQLYSRANPREAMTPQEIPRHPWDKVAIDFKTHKSGSYLIAVDYHSKFLVVDPVPDKTADTIVGVLEKMFAMLGAPSTICSDNGPPFDSKPYITLLDSYGITRQTSSPRYPESNGMIERHIQVVKGMLHKFSDNPKRLSLAVLNYNATPKNNLPSPAEMLQGRRFKTQLPMAPQLRTPKFNTTKQYKVLQHNANIMVQRRKNTKLPDLQVGQPVTVQMGPRDWKTATVKTKLDHNSYNVQMETGGILRRNRLHLRPVKQTSPTRDRSHATEIKPLGSTVFTRDPEVEQPKDYRTRSGRLAVRPQRMDL